jgi:hypothetical protein
MAKEVRDTIWFIKDIRGGLHETKGRKLEENKPKDEWLYVIGAGG